MKITLIPYSQLKTIIKVTKQNGIAIAKITSPDYEAVVSAFMEALFTEKILKKPIKDITEIFLKIYVIVSKTKEKTLILLFKNNAWKQLDIKKFQLFRNKHTNIMYLPDFINYFESEFAESKMSFLKKLILEKEITIGQLVLEAGDTIYLPLNEKEVDLELGAVPQKDNAGKVIGKKDSIIPFSPQGDVLTSMRADPKDINDLKYFLSKAGMTQEVAKIFDSSVKDVQIKNDNNILTIQVNPDDPKKQHAPIILKNPALVKDFEKKFGAGAYTSIKNIVNKAPIKEEAPTIEQEKDHMEHPEVAIGENKYYSVADLDKGKYFPVGMNSHNREEALRAIQNFFANSGDTEETDKASLEAMPPEEFYKNYADVFDFELDETEHPISENDPYIPGESKDIPIEDEKDMSDMQDFTLNVAMKEQVKNRFLTNNFKNKMK